MEVLLSPHCTKTFDTIASIVRSYLESRCSNYSNGSIDFSDDEQLVHDIVSIRVCDIEDQTASIPFWFADLQIYVYTVNNEGSIAEVIEGAGDVTAYHEWMLPCSEFEHLWDQYVICITLTLV